MSQEERTSVAPLVKIFDKSKVALFINNDNRSKIGVTYSLNGGPKQPADAGDYGRVIIDISRIQPPATLEFSTFSAPETNYKVLIGAGPSIIYTTDTSVLPAEAFLGTQATNTERIRYNVTYLQKEKPDLMDKVVWAFSQICNKQVYPPTSVDRVNARYDLSFFTIASYHGEPYRGDAATKKGVGRGLWGGYCQHANVLFPSWHRPCVWRIEEALRSVPGCEDVTLPFWDENSEDTSKNGLPTVFTDLNYTFKRGIPGISSGPGSLNSTIPNPLRSYKIPVEVDITLAQQLEIELQSSKPADYNTCRYPYRGFCYSDVAAAQSQQHNVQYDNNQPLALEKLNQNIKAWINMSRTVKTSMADKYKSSLQCVNYSVFSNTSTANNYNSPRSPPPSPRNPATPLESPHNSGHLAIGGLSAPIPGKHDHPFDTYAAGDMAENDVAGFDPIFYFHHCYVDYVFWTWQKLHKTTESFVIVDESCEGYVGTYVPETATKYDQGPIIPPEIPGTVYTEDTPLVPFQKVNPDGTRAWVTTKDCFHITNQMNYSYGPGSLDNEVLVEDKKTVESTVLSIPVKKSDHLGSFVVNAFAWVDGKEELVGVDPVLSRFGLAKCRNCISNDPAGRSVFVIPDNIKSSSPPSDQRFKKINDDLYVRVEIQERAAPTPAIAPAEAAVAGHVAAAVALPEAAASRLTRRAVNIFDVDSAAFLMPK